MDPLDEAQLETHKTHAALRIHFSLCLCFNINTAFNVIAFELNKQLRYIKRYLMPVYSAGWARHFDMLANFAPNILGNFGFSHFEEIGEEKISCICQNSSAWRNNRDGLLGTLNCFTTPIIKYKGQASTKTKRLRYRWVNVLIFSAHIRTQNYVYFYSILHA